MTGEKGLIGAVLAERWEVLNTLGRGGMGSVYRARHVHLGTDVAIKVLQNTAGLEQADVARFYRESQLIASLRHDHIIRVQDTGKTPAGDLFFVMEYLQGPNLRGLLRSEGPLSWTRARAIILQICDALQVIHANGMIHRDLKPQNIVLDPRRENPDFVKLLDFGVAKLVTDDPQELTKTGVVIGTLAYMAPEYLSGSPPDGRIDIYALGVITFELITGRLPSPSPFANARELQRRGVPETAREVIARATAPDPEYRYPDAESFASALKGVVDETELETDDTTVRRFPPVSEPAGLLSSAPQPAAPRSTEPLDAAALEAVETLALVEPPTIPPGAERMLLAPAPSPKAASPASPPHSERTVLAPIDDPVASTGEAFVPSPTSSARGAAAALLPVTARPDPGRATTRPHLRRGTARSVALPLLTLGGVFAALFVFWPRAQPVAGADDEPVMPPVANQSGAELDPPAPPGPSVEPEPVKPTETVDSGAKPEPPAAPEAPPPAVDTPTAVASEDRPKAPGSPSSRAKGPISGKTSYHRKERAIRAHVRECGKKGLGDEGLLLRISIDGQQGRAAVEVRGPALAIGEPPATCAIRAIQSLEFDKFEGKPFSIEKWFNFSD